jgi:thioredoxin reductase (NADPH)
MAYREHPAPGVSEHTGAGVYYGVATVAGDVRAGAMNRVASAVGEGSMAVRFVHEYLALT